MPSTQGNPNRLNEDKLMVCLSASLNVESESESTNDTRVGLEFAWLHRKLYLAAEAYYMNVGFTSRQKIDSPIITWADTFRAVILWLRAYNWRHVMISSIVTAWIPMAL